MSVQPSLVDTLLERMKVLRVIPVLRLSSQESASRAIDLLIAAGYGTVEVTLTTPGAVELIASLRRRVPEHFLVGAGTVLDAEAAQRCINAGADYLVAPCMVVGLVAQAHGAARAALLGAFTPGEVLAAWREGAQAVKLFPAATG